MKTVFIINPKAGQGNNSKRLIAEIEKNILSENYDAEIYVTKCVGDAKSYVNDFCKKKGPARFIACGGDGTLGEVVNGAFFYEGVQIGVIPIGTGNDFCRNFSEKFDFSDIRSQFEGKAEKCDVIYYKTKLDGEKNEGYCINMINIGFDCNVADMSAQMKKKPFISGSMSYFLSIFACMIKKKGADFSLEADGKKIHSGRLLLASVANGSYCGGGIKSNPLATVNDGVMNMNVIKNIKRMQFIPLLPPYMKGKILEVKNIGRYLTNMDCRKIRIKPNGRKMRMCIDGEIIDAGDTTLEVIHNAIEFVGAEKAFCNVYDVNNKTLNM